MRSFTKEAYFPFGLIRFYVLLILVCVSCSKNTKVNEVEAEKAFRKYIDLRFSSTITTKKDILEFATGAHKLAIEQLTEDEFKIFNNLQKISKNSFTVLSVHCASLICSLRYNLSYITKKDDVNVFESKVEKAVELRLDNGSWKISEISDLNTQHVALTPLSSFNK
jgi:hypothetical protein